MSEVIEEGSLRTRGVDGLSEWIDECPLILLNVNMPSDRKRLTLAQ